MRFCCTSIPKSGLAPAFAGSIVLALYVVIATGEHGGVGTKTGDYIIAYALP